VKIDKQVLKEYLRKSKENEYILNLYRIYELCSKATGGDVLKNKKTISILEDKIFTINGKTMPQENRILYETKKILNKSLDNEKLEKERNELLKDLVDLDFKDEQLQKNIKNKIVVLEAKINIPINFLYNACSSFVNIYHSLYINEKILNYNENIKNLHTYNNDNDIENFILKRVNNKIVDKEAKLWKILNN
jgi:hypothetical protein